MLKHIVLLKFKDNISEQEKTNLLDDLGKLKNKIAEIKSFSYGKNNSPENLNMGYDYGFIMEFNNQSDRDVYLYHPEHEAFKINRIFKLIDKDNNPPIVFDY